MNDSWVDIAGIIVAIVTIAVVVYELSKIAV